MLNRFHIHLGVQSRRVLRVLLAVGLAALAPRLAAAAPPPSERITDNLYGTRFLNDDDAWVVGAFGTIYRTHDRGKTWQSQASHTQEPLFAVDFTDTNEGWAVGRSGVIVHTNNGGDSWSAQPSQTDHHLFDVDFVDDEVGCVVGDWGTILITKNGGETWEPHSFSRDVILNSVSMVDRKHAWIAGEAGTVLVTEDGGLTWSEQHTGADKTLFAIHFADRQRGWAVGMDALILHTQDGGATWELQNGSGQTGGLEQVGAGQTFDNPTLYAVTVVGPNGYAVGEIGAIFTSSDSGRTWTREPVPQSWGVSWLRDVAIVPGANGMMVGAGGRRVAIADGRVDLPRESTHAAETPH
ncbi:MAG: hypothetical protein HYR72_06510 [Deltaproteobacteria bacterium]|nr:hypothetical protein [Deltaproteobacteria bacterium]MBI3387098.1 hypothetical protein [Deltaproteobacteria bacterium]